MTDRLNLAEIERRTQIIGHGFEGTFVTFEERDRLVAIARAALRFDDAEAPTSDLGYLATRLSETLDGVVDEETPGDVESQEAANDRVGVKPPRRRK